MVEKITNANERAKVYWCKHMTAGLTGYPDNPNVKGNVLVTNEVMRNMAPSLVGVPIYIDHVDDNSTQESVGYIADSHYCTGDGYLHAKMLICHEEAERLINNGWSVSNGYTPTNKGSGGKYNAIPYEQEILNANFFHMALVQNPRYENARIFTEEEYTAYKKALDEKMLNSKGEKVLPEVDNKDKVIVNNSESNMTEETIKNEAKEPTDDKKENKEPEKKTKPDFMNEKVIVNDQEMTVKELVNAYSAFLKKSEKDKKENEAKKEPEKKQAMTNEAEAKPVDQKEDWLVNAINKNPTAEKMVDFNQIGNRGF